MQASMNTAPAPQTARPAERPTGTLVAGAVGAFGAPLLCLLAIPHALHNPEFGDWMVDALFTLVVLLLWQSGLLGYAAARRSHLARASAVVMAVAAIPALALFVLSIQRGEIEKIQFAVAELAWMILALVTFTLLGILALKMKPVLRRLSTPAAVALFLAAAVHAVQLALIPTDEFRSLGLGISVWRFFALTESVSWGLQALGGAALGIAFLRARPRQPG
jgi:hypothetical protein